MPLLEDSGLEIEFVPVTQNVHNRNTNRQHQPPTCSYATNFFLSRPLYSALLHILESTR